MNQVASLHEHRGPSEQGYSQGRPSEIATSDARRAFIDDYLRLRMYELTDANRIIVACGIDAFSGGDSPPREELTRFLDQLYSLYSL